MDGMNNGGQGGGIQTQQQMPQQQHMMQPQMNMQNPQLQMMQQPGMMGGMQQMGIGQPPAFPGYGFEARPQVIKKKRYRDPYREFIKVAPQNIMYDRRVVRGNTFAALVIPVNMQPDPALIEKQRLEEAYMKQKQEEMRQRRLAQERQREKDKEEEREQNIQMAQMQNQNQWEELSDYQKMENEFDIEPDYYIDRAPDAVFIPNPEGEVKSTQIWEGDPYLFDYENEVEPILQVLVGKSIEHARIEVIEEFEALELKKHKQRYQSLREAELMETQRLEEGRNRKNDEVDRRNLQMRIAKNQLISTDRKIVARTFAKDFLRTFKKDTLQILVDIGSLRKPVQLSVGAIYLPQLYSQIQTDMQRYHDHQESMDEILGGSMQTLALSHKQSIIKEHNRRQDKKKEEMRKKREEEEARAKRKQKRAALRERYRLSLLKDQITRDIVSTATQEEYTPKLQIYDVRSPLATNDGVIVIGGFVGELIITFTCMLDYILASPQNQNFFFSVEMIEAYLKDLLGGEATQFQDGICTINLLREFSEINGKEATPDQVAKLARDPKNMADFGLRFVFELQKDLVLVPDIIEAIYRAVCRIAIAKPTALQQIPELDPEADEQNREEHNQLLQKVRETNEQIEKENERKTQLQKKVQIRALLNQSELYDDEPEKALIKLNNFRETVVGPDGNILSARTGGSGPMDQEAPAEEQFNPDKIPPKIPLVKPKSDFGLQVAAYHSEAPYAIRKVFIQHAIKHFRELEKVEISAILQHSYQRSKMLEDRFEDKFIKNYGYGRGNQHTDPNHRMTFKTFLQD